MLSERGLRWSLFIVAIAGLAAGVIAHLVARSSLAGVAWTLATVPVIAGLSVSMARDLLAGRLGVDAIALLSMAAALVLGQPLAGAVIALMYSGGNVLEVIAVSRAERNLRLLVDRAPRLAHRRTEHGTVDLPVAEIAVGDGLVVRAGEVIPVDGIIESDSATIDEAALTGEPIPVVKSKCAAITPTPPRPLIFLDQPNSICNVVPPYGSAAGQLRRQTPVHAHRVLWIGDRICTRRLRHRQRPECGLKWGCIRRHFVGGPLPLRRGSVGRPPVLERISLKRPTGEESL
jgi:E1-E2 ATPase